MRTTGLGLAEGSSDFLSSISGEDRPITNTRTLVAVLSFGLVAMAPATAQASTIRLLTGVDTADNVLADGALDPRWTISTNGGASFEAAKVVFPVTICCGMETVGPQAKWISDQSVNPSNPNTGWGIGNIVIARRTFDFTNVDLSTAALSGIWRVADSRRGVYLNGTLIGAATNDGLFGFGADQAISAASALFVPGVNTLELRGDSVNSAWDGFWLDATVTADDVAPVPEPGSMLLLGTGLVGLGRARRKRRG